MSPPPGPVAAAAGCPGAINIPLPPPLASSNIETNYLDHTIPTNQPTSQPASQPTNQPASQPTNQPTSQPASQPTNQPTTTHPARQSQGEGECFLPVKSAKKPYLPTPFAPCSKVSCFTVVFFRQSATVNLDEKCKIGIQNAILLQRRCEVIYHISLLYGNLPAFLYG